MKPGKIKHLALAMALSAIAVSCNLEEHYGDLSENNPALKINLSGEISQVYQTRVNDSGFCDGDEVGIYIVDYNNSSAGELLDNGNRADNVKHTFNESAYRWESPYDIFFKDSQTNVDIYGYYPYSSPTSVKEYLFEVQKDQSSSAAYGKVGGYEASDFLWGKAENIAPTAEVIKLGFRHIMASARITLAEGTGFNEGEWASLNKAVLVLNTIRESKINLATGQVLAVGDVPSTGTIPYVSNNDYRAIIVPQTVKAGVSLLSITVGGISYDLTKDADFTYYASKQHNFTIQVNKRNDSGYEFVLTSESITAWENDSVSHDADAREYIIINIEEAGTLKECLESSNNDKSKVKNLKLTGYVNANDFYFMRDEMDNLQALNLKEVQIKATYDTYDEYVPRSLTRDNYIPFEGFRSKPSLMRLVLPDKLEGIGETAFYFCTNLTGSLIIPEGVTEIHSRAFEYCRAMTGSLQLPSTLQKIEDYAFSGCGFASELILPDNLTYIGEGAFGGCENLYGALKLPDKLSHVGSVAFRGCKGLTGSLEIPQTLTTIYEQAFMENSGMTGTLKLHNGITAIGAYAFEWSGFRGELNLPEGLVVINECAFNCCDFTGTLKLPKDIAMIGDMAFANNWRLMGTIEFPKSINSIGNSAFAGCSSIEGLVFEEGIETIGKGAFSNCFGINKIVCKSAVPPVVMPGAFDGVPKESFTLEVPESSIHLYETAQGWGDFKRISAYRNLVIRPSIATAINTSVTRNLILNADEEWTVESYPEWISLDKTTGTGKTEIKQTFAQMPQGTPDREGEVVFKLVNKEYRTRCKVTQYDYQYKEDEILTLQSATKGKGINLVFLGDGYNAKDISDGKLLANINEAVEHFFNIEPYKTYRNYFNVYTGIAVSPESGIGGVNTIVYNRFNTTAKGGVTLGGRNSDDTDYRAIFEYACKAPTVDDSNLNNSLIIMIPNTEEYGGICYMYEDGAAIAYCPMSDYGYPTDFRGVVQHEAGGHGFGKLGDEYIYHNAFIDACSCSCCGHVMEFLEAKYLGWFENLSLTGKMDAVPWSHLIFHDKYDQIVDIFEGGYMHTRGVYRSEHNSCMNNNIPYFSTISRETIVKRIKSIAGEEYNFDDFVANDVMDAGSAELSSTKSTIPQTLARPIHRNSPVFMGKRPSVNK